MSKRVGGFINQDGLNAPDSPTSVSAAAGNTEATVSFTAPSNVGGSAVTGYVATSNDGIGATGSASPITVTGLTNDTAYTFRVWALNAFGYSAPSGASGSVTPSNPDTGVFFGAGDPNSDVIQYISISSTGNATDWGDLAVAQKQLGALGNSIRALAFGGTGTTYGSNVIQYITFATTGNAQDFGDLLKATGSQENIGMAGTANDTRGILMGGQNNNQISYVTIASTGNAVDFGDFSTTSRSNGGAGSNGTRAVFGGDAAGIEYVTIASTGNAVSFGNLFSTRNQMEAGCSSTRTLWMGGNDGDDRTIDFVTTATTGNAVDFGNLVSAAFENGACSNKTRAVCAHGYNGSAFTNVMSYVTMATTGDSVDFGDLLAVGSQRAGASDCHGGLS
jgi:large repetitive protein